MRRIKKLLKRALSQRFANRSKALIFAGMARKTGLRLRASDRCFDLEKNGNLLRIGSAHTVYLPHVIHQFNYYFDSVIPISDKGRQIVDMSGPRYHRLVGFGDIPFLFPSLTEPFSTTAEYLDFADLHSGDTVMDIGAYSGVTSIIFAQLVHPGHVYAFEADKSNFECATVNLDMARRVMGLDNITLINKAVWSHNNGIVFSNEGAMGSSAVAITGGGRGLETTVPSITLEEFLAQSKIGKVDFVKMDIEGGESEVLKFSAKTLHGTGAKIILEPHWVDGRMNTEECCALLRAAGFVVDIRKDAGSSDPLIEATAH